MIYNPVSKKLYTDDKILIKKLDCPYRKHWDQLSSLNTPGARLCSQCDHLVWDTAKMTGEELLQKIAANPNTCLKIDPKQKNITVSLYV